MAHRWRGRITEQQSKRARGIAAKGGATYLPVRDYEGNSWLNTMTVAPEYMVGREPNAEWVPPQEAVGSGTNIAPGSREENLSKTLTFLLRHAAVRLGLEVDPAGWVLLPELMAYLRGSHVR